MVKALFYSVCNLSWPEIDEEGCTAEGQETAAAHVTHTIGVPGAEGKAGSGMCR